MSKHPPAAEGRLLTSRVEKGGEQAGVGSQGKKLEAWRTPHLRAARCLANSEAPLGPGETTPGGRVAGQWLFPEPFLSCPTEPQRKAHLGISPQNLSRKRRRRAKKDGLLHRASQGPGSSPAGWAAPPCPGLQQPRPPHGRSGTHARPDTHMVEISPTYKRDRPAQDDTWKRPCGINQRKYPAQTHHGLNYGQIKLLSAPVTGSGGRPLRAGEPRLYTC